MCKCIVCDIEFKYKSWKSNKYCSIKCYRAFQRSSKYKLLFTTTVKGQCKNCNKDVLKSFKRKRNGDKADFVFCNRECYDKYRANIIIKTKQKKCKQCNIQFIGHSKNSIYCCEKCRIDFNFNMIKDKYNIIKLSLDKKKYVKECKICKKEFEVNKQKAKTTICSKECISEFYKSDKSRKKKISNAFQGELHPNYINGCSYNPRVRNTEKKEYFSKNDKKNVFALFANKCFNCESIENLCIDHHIPFSKGGRLNKNNSVILCRSCNSSKNAKNPEDFYSKAKLLKLEKLGISTNSILNA